MKKLIIFIISFSSFFATAQDDLLNMLDNEHEPKYVSYLFKGTKVVNGQSVELLGF